MYSVEDGNLTDLNLLMLLSTAHGMDGKELPVELAGSSWNRNEDCICIHSQALQAFMDPLSSVIEITSRNRQTEEWYGEYIQLVVAACIHTDDTILLLELNSVPENISSYRKGMLTLVQGHVTASPGLMRDAQYIRRSPDVLDKFILRLAIYDEICEEVTTVDPNDISYFQYDIWHLIKHAPIPIIRYLTGSGSQSRHVYIIYNLNVKHDGSFLDSAIKNKGLKSGEPEKHAIKYCTMSDLVRLPSMNLLCPYLSDYIACADWTKRFVDDFAEEYMKERAEILQKKT